MYCSHVSENQGLYKNTIQQSNADNPTGAPGAAIISRSLN